MYQIICPEKNIQHNLLHSLSIQHIYLVINAVKIVQILGFKFKG